MAGEMRPNSGEAEGDRPTEAKEPSPPVDWVDIAATLVMAVAAILTAWSAFQSDQWGDQMSFSLAQGSAARTEATREFTRAGQLTAVDVASFFAWIDALQTEVAEGTIDASAGYSPDPETVSGFLYLRFRPEFRTATDIWVEARPFVNPDAPPTPFAMPEYQVAEEIEAQRLQERADAKYQEAQDADANDDKYVLSTIIFAAVFLFAGMSTKMRSNLGQNLMLGFGLVLLIAAAAYIFTNPILL